MGYDAVAFLNDLWNPPALPGPDDLPGDWRVAWEERAAIMEYDGGLPRERAEALAMTDILRQMKAGNAAEKEWQT